MSILCSCESTNLIVYNESHLAML